MNPIEVRIEGAEASTVSPEGKRAAMPVEELMRKLRPPRMDCGDVVLPAGIRGVLSQGPLCIWVHEIPPGIRNLKWIANDSPAPFGPGATYRDVQIGLPYVVVMAVFIMSAQGAFVLSKHNECFFRTAPLQSLAEPLSYPALLNCSRFNPPEGRPLAWICTQYLDESYKRQSDTGQRMRAGLAALLNCLLHTGFNRSSEHHEFSSWFTESRHLDARLATIEEWEKATKHDPLFALEIPWIPTGLSVRQMAERIFQNHRAGHLPVNAASMARLIFNYKPGSA